MHITIVQISVIWSILQSNDLIKFFLSWPWCSGEQDSFFKAFQGVFKPDNNELQILVKQLQDISQC